jgi:CII-binding regulator of phage lambda lysogenization HflD
MAPTQHRTDDPDYSPEHLLFASVISLASILFVVIIWLTVMIFRERKYTFRLLLLEKVIAETHTKYAVHKARSEAELLHTKDELDQSKENAAELQKKINELEKKVKATKNDKPAVCDVCGRIRRYMEKSPRQSKTDVTSSRPFQATVVSAPTSPLWAPVSRD